MKNKRVHLEQLANRFTLVFILVVFVSILGATYAYLYVTDSDNTTISGDMATVNLSMDVQEVLPIAESTGVMVPQLSSETLLSTALKRGCVDDNSNIVCKVYRIYIKNDGGSASEVVSGKISFAANPAFSMPAEEVMPNLRWKLIDSFDSANFNNSVLGNQINNSATLESQYFVSDVFLSTNKEYTYYMIVWFDETNQDQIDEGNTFYGSVAFESSNGTGVTATFS